MRDAGRRFRKKWAMSHSLQGHILHEGERERKKESSFLTAFLSLLYKNNARRRIKAKTATAKISLQTTSSRQAFSKMTGRGERRDENEDDDYNDEADGGDSDE